MERDGYIETSLDAAAESKGYLKRELVQSCRGNVCVTCLGLESVYLQAAVGRGDYR
jgi:hypothetical protein